MPILVLAGTWLILCAWVFHGVLEVRDAPPTERHCTGWLLRTWCEERVARFRAEAVRQGMLHAWRGYKAFAWGADEIHPESKTAKSSIRVGRAMPMSREGSPICDCKISLYGWLFGVSPSGSCGSNETLWNVHPRACGGAVTA